LVVGEFVEMKDTARHTGQVRQRHTLGRKNNAATLQRCTDTHKTFVAALGRCKHQHIRRLAVSVNTQTCTNKQQIPNLGTPVLPHGTAAHRGHSIQACEVNLLKADQARLVLLLRDAETIRVGGGGRHCGKWPLNLGNELKVIATEG
jgi:hypothetical protein